MLLSDSGFPSPKPGNLYVISRNPHDPIDARSFRMFPGLLVKYNTFRFLGPFTFLHLGDIILFVETKRFVGKLLTDELYHVGCGELFGWVSTEGLYLKPAK